jgi:flagellin
MIQTAEGALTEMNSLLIGMRELAIHAANEGFNDADQLAADQAEIRNALSTIDRIAANTQFGTKNLLDGTKENVATITSGNTSLATLTNSQLGTGTYNIAATKTADPTAALNTTSLGVSLNYTDGNPVNLSEGVHNVDVVQASDVAKRTSGSISIKDAWSNDLTIASGAAAAATLSTVGAVAAPAVAANVGDYTVLVSYQENGGTPITNKAISFSVALADTAANIETKLQAALDSDSDLAGKVNSSEAAGVISIETADVGAQFSLKVEASSSTATTEILSFAQGDSRGVSDSSLTFNTVTNIGGAVAGALTLTDGTYADMTVLLAEVNAQILATYGGATTDITAVLDGTDKIQIQTVDEGSDYSIAFNAVSGSSGDLENVLGFGAVDDSVATAGVDAIINFNGYANTITSIKADDGGTQQIASLETAALGDSSRASLEIQYAEATMSGTENGINTGAMLLTATATKFSVQLNGGPATIATAGQNATVYNGDRSEYITVNYGLTSTGGNETISNLDQSLVFQIGGNVGQTANISLRNMASTALGKNSAGNMFANLSLIDVTTSAGAQDAQRLIDIAINEVSTTRGTLGSFQKNTLESNLRNLRVAAQNLTASESQIRDTDMASEMSNFTRDQILMQAGTAMLAQANQVPQVVLSLFG